MNTTQMREVFLRLAVNLQAIVHEVPREPLVLRNPALLIRGGLILQGDIVHEYTEAVRSMTPAPGGNEAWSESTIDAALSQALEQLLLAENDPTEARKQSADAFLSSLRRQTIRYEIAISVFGLAPDCTGKVFGRMVLEPGSFTPAVSYPGTLIAGQPHAVLFGKVSVDAMDQDTAELRAGAVIDQHLNVLNAICSDPPPSYVRLSRRYAGSHSASVMKVSNLKTGEMAERTLGSIQRRLLGRQDFEKDLNDRGGERVSKMLLEANGFNRRVTAALEIAGAACIEDREHEAFLLFAIALESAVLGRDTQSELTFQLATRTAHLLATSLGARKEVVKSVKRLYGLRSKIVHTGATSIRVEDVKEIRFICMTSLLSLVLESRFEHFETAAELEVWFEEQALGAGPSVSTVDP